MVGPLAQFAAATDRGAADEICNAARSLPPEQIRELLRLLSIFLGFPKVLRALQCLSLPPETLDITSTTASTNGEEFFRQLYGSDADRVLLHLEGLDSLLHQWVLNHAYGTVLSRPTLSLSTRIRLILLALAATQCWKQWQSHYRNAQRHGIRQSQILDDLESHNWLTSADKEKVTAWVQNHG
ncbi:MAG: carboxymuconolactone decarboxylase family protein [Planctomycetota bacterium]|nr:carboxymuconolactone decarboxylase family protein [Planctomycetota bacterium]